MLLTGRAIPFDNATEHYFVAGDPTLVDFEYLIDLFGDYEYLIVGIELLPQSEDIFQAETLKAISALTDFFDSHQHVTQVRSLTNYQYTRTDGDGLSTDYLIDDINALENDPATLSNIRAIIADEELALDTLISEDFKHSRITARVEYRTYTAAHKVELAQDFYQFMVDEKLDSGNYTLHYSGYPLLSERFETLAQEDLSVLIPIMVALMAVMLFIGFGARIYWTGWNERLELLSVWNKLADSQGYVTRVSMEYDWTDSLNLGILWVDYNAENNSIFYNFRNNDMVQFNLRFSFQN